MSLKHFVISALWVGAIAVAVATSGEGEFWPNVGAVGIALAIAFATMFLLSTLTPEVGYDD